MAGERKRGDDEDDEGVCSCDTDVMSVCAHGGRSEAAVLSLRCRMFKIQWQKNKQRV